MRKVLVIDDDRAVHAALGAVARAAFGEPELFFASGLADGCQQARAADPLDLALLDLGLPGCSGTEAASVFRDCFPGVRFAVISGREDRAAVLGSLRAGASGYLPKTHGRELMAAALRVVAAGGVYLPPQVLDGCDAAPGGHPFTGRQLDVMKLIVKGLANREIAGLLRIAEHTVKQHASAAYAALGVASRSQAITTLIRRGIRLD